MTKKQEEYTVEEQRARLALANQDIEIFGLNKTLEPYSLGQYDIKMREQQMQTLLRQDVTTNFFKGCILLEIKGKENSATFAHFLQEACGGMSRRSAYYYMTFTKKCIDLKKLKEFGQNNWSKMITLMHSCTDEELKEIEEKGIRGKPLSEYDNLSVPDFKRLMKKLEEEKDKIVAEETRGIRLERDQALEENKKLKARDSDAKTVEGFALIFKSIENKADEIWAAAARLDFEKVHEDAENEGRLRVQYQRGVELLEARFISCIKQLQKSVALDTGI